MTYPPSMMDSLAWRAEILLSSWPGTSVTFGSIRLKRAHFVYVHISEHKNHTHRSILTHDAFADGHSTANGHRNFLFSPVQTLTPDACNSRCFRLDRGGSCEFACAREGILNILQSRLSIVTAGTYTDVCVCNIAKILRIWVYTAAKRRRRMSHSSHTKSANAFSLITYIF